MSKSERDDASAVICERIVRSHEFMSSHTIGCYLATADEVQTNRIIERAWRARKRVFVPVIDSHLVMTFCEITPESVLVRNRMGIWEPVSGQLIDARNLDIVVTPVVAFDDDKHRVGMGGGCYDRCFHFLKNRRKWLKPKLIGVAFECQKSPRFSPNPWDVALYRIVTNSK